LSLNQKIIFAARSAFSKTWNRSMKRVLIGALTAVALSISPFALTAAVAAGDQAVEAPGSERTQHWAADHWARRTGRAPIRWGCRASLEADSF